VLLPAAVVMAVGSVVTGIGFGNASFEALMSSWVWRVPATVGGLGLVAAAGLRAVWGLRRLLAEDSYIALRTDGVVVAESGGRTVEVPWDDLVECRLDDDGETLRLERCDGSLTRVRARFSGIDPAGLARRVEHLRRRTAFGLPS
jgi:hypothetical protein